MTTNMRIRTAIAWCVLFTIVGWLGLIDLERKATAAEQAVYSGEMK